MVNSLQEAAAVLSRLSTRECGLWHDEIDETTGKLRDFCRSDVRRNLVSCAHCHEGESDIVDGVKKPNALDDLVAVADYLHRKGVVDGRKGYTWRIKHFGALIVDADTEKMQLAISDADEPELWQKIGDEMEMYSNEQKRCARKLAGIIDELRIRVESAMGRTPLNLLT